MTNVARKGVRKNPLYKEDKRKKEEENTDKWSPTAWNEVDSEVGEEKMEERSPQGIRNH